MKISLYLILACAIAILLVAGGCTQTAQPTPTPTPVPTAVPTQVPTAAPTAVPTILTPVPTTVAPAIPLPVSIKDSQLLFTIFAPEGYTGTTIRVKTADYSIVYKTTIFNPATAGANETIVDNSGNYKELPDSLTIFSYSSSYRIDQNILDTVRGSHLPFTESAVTYNGVKYSRIEVIGDPYTLMPAKTVFYVGDKGTANENGYLPVMIYTMTPGGSLSQASYDAMAQSFRYYPAKNMGSAAGTETDRPSFYQ
jgi:hypothetical protein